MINGLRPLDNYSDLWHPCEIQLVFRITHEELQSYVVDKDVIQWNNAQLAKVDCQLQGINLLHKTGTGWTKHKTY